MRLARILLRQQRRQRACSQPPQARPTSFRKPQRSVLSPRGRSHSRLRFPLLQAVPDKHHSARAGSPRTARRLVPPPHPPSTTSSPLRPAPPPPLRAVSPSAPTISLSSRTAASASAPPLQRSGSMSALRPRFRATSPSRAEARSPYRRPAP